ncbi:MAG: AEC family transporter [Clostridiales bacterium]|nr:AEC family transporter [Clostridiales bacterium]
MELLSYAGSVATQVAVMLLLILTGFILARAKLVDDKGTDQLVNVLFYAVTPVVIVDSFLRVEFTPAAALSLLVMAGCAVMAHAAGILLSWLVFRRWGGDGRSVLRASSVFSNCGFMSLPLAQGLLGPSGVFLVSVYVAVHNLLIWTVGLRFFTGGKMSVKKAVLNPGVIGVLVGLPLFFSGLGLPAALTGGLTHIANLNTPLAMLVIGCYLAAASLRPEKGDGRMWTAMALRLLAVPLLCLAAFKLCGLSGDLLTACMIPASAPVAANVVMFAAKFGGDARLASRIIPISTVVSILTIPLMLTLAML